MQVIARTELPEDYSEMMKTESHHEHQIIMDARGVIRWKKDNAIDKLVDHMGLNEIVEMFHRLGHGKNSEIYRKLYRNMGYSLSGYWEVFYWEVNNEEADQYRPPIA